jgi:single-stranded-DNA-specific exonuclease
MLYEWILPESSVLSQKTVFSKTRIPPIIENILIDRNINNEDLLKKYINPKLSDLHDPFLMKDMEIAVNRIITALQKGENILIYGDYDVDGVTGVSILHEALHRLGGKVSFFIPDRLKDGYGVSKTAIDTAKKRGVSLIITVDCGVTANEEIEYANAFEIETIICDHHEAVGEIPDSLAVLNPKLPDSKYPYKELAGCGVAFKLLQALCIRLDMDSSFFERYLDLVALGTSADIVDLAGENRIFVYNGLKKINSRERYGISELIDICGLKRQEITVNLIVFVLAPRLNAVGRISNAKKAVHLLTSTGHQQAKNIAQILNSENQQRRDIDELTLREAEEIISSSTDLDKTGVLVLAKKNWHLGVLGIVASRILEKYNKPTVMISINNGVGKASARSFDRFNIFSALNELSDLLVSYGGHACAAGLTIKSNKIDLFREKINIIAKNYVKLSNQRLELKINSVVTLNQFDAQVLRWLKILAPYGPNNMRPVFVSNYLTVSGKINEIGENHIKFKVKQNGVVIDAIAFNMKKYHSILSEKNIIINCAYVLEESNWQGQTTIQLRIKDFEVADGTE